MSVWLLSLPTLAARWLFCSALLQLPGSCTVPFSLSFNFSLFSFPSMGSVTLSPEVRMCHLHPSHSLLFALWAWEGFRVHRCVSCLGSPMGCPLGALPLSPALA